MRSATVLILISWVPLLQLLMLQLSLDINSKISPHIGVSLSFLSAVIGLVLLKKYTKDYIAPS
ncbi:MAG: hypothetical protein GY765_21960, partial [bacterium]|nr:hypothetical protein [bacterium]